MNRILLIISLFVLVAPADLSARQEARIVYTASLTEAMQKDLGSEDLAAVDDAPRLIQTGAGSLGIFLELMWTESLEFLNDWLIGIGLETTEVSTLSSRTKHPGGSDGSHLQRRRP